MPIKEFIGMLCTTWRCTLIDQSYFSPETGGTVDFAMERLVRSKNQLYELFLTVRVMLCL